MCVYMVCTSAIHFYTTNSEHFSLNTWLGVSFKMWIVPFKIPKITCQFEKQSVAKILKRNNITNLEDAAYNSLI